jgi:hypothetical protein
MPPEYIPRNCTTTFTRIPHRSRSVEFPKSTTTVSEWRSSEDCTPRPDFWSTHREGYQVMKVTGHVEINHRRSKVWGGVGVDAFVAPGDTIRGKGRVWLKDREGRVSEWRVRPGTMTTFKATQDGPRLVPVLLHGSTAARWLRRWYDEDQPRDESGTGGDGVTG